MHYVTWDITIARRLRAEQNVSPYRWFVNAGRYSYLMCGVSLSSSFVFLQTVSRRIGGHEETVVLFCGFRAAVRRHHMLSGFAVRLPPCVSTLRITCVLANLQQEWSNAVTQFHNNGQLEICGSSIQLLALSDRHSLNYKPSFTPYFLTNGNFWDHAEWSMPL